MKKMLIVPAALVAVSLTACGLGGPNEGEVVSKNYKEADEWTVKVKDYDKKCTGTGTRRKCKKVFDGYDEETRTSDECYEVVFKNEGEEGKACVSEETYDSLEVGDWYKD